MTISTINIFVCVIRKYGTSNISRYIDILKLKRHDSNKSLKIIRLSITVFLL